MPRQPRRSLLRLVAPILAVVVACRASERGGPTPAVDPAQATAGESARPAAPVPTAEPAALQESSATLEVAVAAPPEPTAEPAFLSVPPPPADEPEHCLTLEASPSSISAYGASGPAVQLVVRARNACASGFSGPSVYFRAVAVSMEGSELASATGRFSGEIRPYSTAETLIAIETDPTRVRTWRVELR